MSKVPGSGIGAGGGIPVPVPVPVPATADPEKKASVSEVVAAVHWVDLLDVETAGLLSLISNVTVSVSPAASVKSKPIANDTSPLVPVPLVLSVPFGIPLVLFSVSPAASLMMVDEPGSPTSHV